MKVDICQFYLFHNKFVAKTGENCPCPRNRLSEPRSTESWEELRRDELNMGTCSVVQTASQCVQIQLRPRDLIRQV